MENLSDENPPNENTQPNPQIKQQITQIVDTEANKTEETKIITKNLFQKFKSFTLDVAIVVIGVSLSIWFNDIVTHYNQQKEVKKFLLGLQADFVGDIKEMEEDKVAYWRNDKVFGYIGSLKKGQTADLDSVDKYDNSIFSNVSLISNDSRFQGFKSAGKMGLIEDDLLQNDILDLYQEDIVILLLSTDHLIKEKEKFRSYIKENKIRLTDSTNNMKTLLASEYIVNTARYEFSGIKGVINKYDICINKMKKISQAIENKYK